MERKELKYLSGIQKYTRRLHIVSDDENQQSCTSSPIREMSPETEKIFNILTNEMLEEPCEDSFVERCSENPLQGIVSIKDSSHFNERQTYVEASDSNDEETVCPFKPKDVINSMSGSECTVVQRIDNTQSRQETYIEASDDEELASCLQRDCTNEVRNLKDRERSFILENAIEETEVNKSPINVSQMASGEVFQKRISEGKVLFNTRTVKCSLD